MLPARLKGILAPMVMLLIIALSGCGGGLASDVKVLEKAIASQDWDTVSVLSKKMVQEHPERPEGYYFQGVYYYHQKAWQQAIDNLKKATELAPAYAGKGGDMLADSYIQLGIKLFDQDYQQSLELFKNASEASRDKSTGRRIAGIIMDQVNKKTAEKNFYDLKDYLPLLQAALQYDAANERVLFYTGVACRLRNENEEAIKYFDQLAPRLAPDSLPDRLFHFPSDAYFVAGRNMEYQFLQAGRNDFQPVIDLYRKSLAWNDKNDFTLQRMTWLMVTLDRKDEAREYFRRWQAVTQMPLSTAEFEQVLASRESLPAKQLKIKPGEELVRKNERPQYDYELVWTGDGRNLLLAEWNEKNIKITRFNPEKEEQETIYAGEWMGERPAMQAIDGKIVLRNGKELVFFDANDFKVLRTVKLPVFDRWLEVSPDGSRMVYVQQGLWLADLNNSRRILLARAGKERLLPSQPQWSPAGDKVLYIDMYYEGSGGIWVIDLNSDEKKKIVDLDGCFGARWTNDGQAITFGARGYGQEEPPAMYIYDLGTSNTRRIPFGQNYAAISFSPDGQRLLLQWMEETLWVKDIAEDTPRLITKKPGYFRSCWSPDGRYLVYGHQFRRDQPPSFWLVDLARDNN
jgi:tetratricopeptide (TPR) repeat protein